MSEIDMYGNGIGVDGAKAVCEALKVNKSLVDFSNHDQ